MQSPKLTEVHSLSRTFATVSYERVRYIGVAGPAGAGKDLAADMMCELFGAENLSTGDVVRAIARHVYRLPANEMPIRDQLFPVATFLRSEIDPAFTVKLCMEQAKVLSIDRAIMTGLRSLAEAEAIRAKGGFIIGIDADPRIRYDRIFTRARDSEATKSFEEFLAQDERENLGVDGKGVRTIVDSADLVLENNGSSLEDLKALLCKKVGPLLG